MWDHVFGVVIYVEMADSWRSKIKNYISIDVSTEVNSHANLENGVEPCPPTFRSDALSFLRAKVEVNATSRGIDDDCIHP